MARTNPSCPHCGHHIKPMPPSFFEAEHWNTRYQCGNCMRVWSLPKVPLAPQPPS